MTSSFIIISEPATENQPAPPIGFHTIWNPPGDGNCLIACLVKSIYPEISSKQRISSLCQKLRGQVIQHLKDCHSLYENCFGEEFTSYEQMIKALHKKETFFDSPAIDALGFLYGTQFVVHKKLNNNSDFLHYTVCHEAANVVRTVHVMLSGDRLAAHYRLLKNDDSFSQGYLAGSSHSNMETTAIDVEDTGFNLFGFGAIDEDEQSDLDYFSDGGDFEDHLSSMDIDHLSVSSSPTPSQLIGELLPLEVENITAQSHADCQGIQRPETSMIENQIGSSCKNQYLQPVKHTWRRGRGGKRLGAGRKSNFAKAQRREQLISQCTGGTNTLKRYFPSDGVEGSSGGNGANDGSGQSQPSKQQYLRDQEFNNQEFNESLFANILHNNENEELIDEDNEVLVLEKDGFQQKV